MSIPDNIPEDLKVWHFNLSLAKHEPANCINLDILGLIERIAALQEEVEKGRDERMSLRDRLSVAESMVERLTAALEATK